MEVTLTINIHSVTHFPEYAGRKNCDNWCPMFLWDGESHDYCAALQSRTDGAPVRCPFFDTGKHTLDIK